MVRPRPLVSVCRWGFFLVGALSALVGPSLGTLSDNVDRDVSSLGVVISFDALGSVIGSLLAGVAFRSLTVRRQGLLACMVIAMAVSAVPFMSTLSTLCIAFLTLGMSKTFLIVTVNTLLVRTRRSAAAAQLNFADFLLGLGSLSMPLLIAACFSVGLGLPLAYASTAIAAAGLGMAFVRLPSFELRQLPHHDGSSNGHRPGQSLRADVVVTLLVGLMLFGYVGLEATFSGWLPTYVRDGGLVAAAATASTFTSLFWVSITLGRLAWMPVVKRLAPVRLLGAAVLLTAVGGSVLVGGRGSVALTIAGVAIVGLGMAPMFPAAFTILAHRTSMSGWVSGVVLCMSSIGAMVIPLIAGLSIVRGAT